MERLSTHRSWTWAAAATLVLLATGASTPVQAGKRIAGVGAVCPPDAPDKQIDASGDRDACVARRAATCGPQQRLVLDASGERDRCVAEGASAASGKKPSCPPGLDLEVKSSADVCERVAKPVCAEGSHLATRQREDVCRY
jgi:hypothetical protein